MSGQSNYSYTPYFQAVCALPSDVQVIYLKALKVASIIVTQHLASRDQIRGVFVAERLTKTEIDRLMTFFPDGVLSFPG